MALGANPGRVVSFVLRQGLMPTLAGIAAGLLGGIALSQFLTAQLFEVRPHDPATAVATAAMVAAISLLACYLPARRAARLDPSAALRTE
jgi:putative ABC transport system permease protein